MERELNGQSASYEGLIPTHLKSAESLIILFQDGKVVSKNGDVDVTGDDDEEEDFKVDEIRPQPWYFHIVASFILVVHGFTFLVPQDSDTDDTDMMRTIGKWFGFDWEWMKPFTPYAQVKNHLLMTLLKF